MSAVQPFRNGEVLSREDFHQRYLHMPNFRAELLNGRVFVTNALEYRKQSSARCMMVAWLNYYGAFTPGTHASTNVTHLLSPTSELQPNGALRIEEASGGHSLVDVDGYIAGIPELFAEVASNGSGYEATDKLLVYREARVNEFIVWRIDEREVDWYALWDGEYQRLPLGSDGIIRSEAFPGLWLDVAAMIGDDGAAVFDTLQRGLAAPEHAEFVSHLKRNHSTRLQDG